MLPSLEDIIHSSHSIPHIPNKVELHLPQLSNIKAIAFDIYGTLLHSGVGEISIVDTDTHRDINFEILDIRIPSKTVQKILKKHIIIHHNQNKCPFPEVNIVHVWKDILQSEQTFSQKFEILHAKTNIDRDTCARYCALYYELEVNPCAIMPQSIELLLKLQNSPIRLGIVSNAQFYTSLILKKIFHPHWNVFDFSAQVWSYQMLEGKPSQNLYKNLLSQWKDLHAENILFVGNDMRNDIDPAARLGIKTCLFAGDSLSYRPRKDMPNLLNPDATITHLSDILTIAGV